MIPLILITGFMFLTPTTAMAEVIGWVTLKDGSLVYGEVVSMTDGTLTVKTTFGKDAFIKIKWEEVTQLLVDTPLPFQLKEGTTLKGKAVEGPSGSLHILAEPLSNAVSVPLSSVTAINPPLIKPVVYKGIRVDCGYRLDLMVNDQVVVELKAVEKTKPIHEAQLLSYLKLSGKTVGLLISFNVKLLKDGLRRFVN